jgi:AcrR family transcriptional regulator
MATTAPQPRTRLSREARMEQTVGVAHALFAERGYAAVTMDDVAAEVGVTKPLLYHYFGNKERLYLAVLERSADALVETVLDAVGATETSAEALGAGLHAFFSFIDEDRAAWGVLFDETLPAGGPIADRVGEYRSSLSGLVAGALLDQIPASKRERARIEVEALSAAVLGAAEALARWWLSTGALSAHEVAELLVASLEPGLRLRSAPRRRAAR